jgi:5-methylcytosine-specific restriction endonuclease McrA
VLVDGQLVSTAPLKARLIREGLKEHRCELCLREAWNGRPIPLELDHINGKRTDNRLANLRILCPNCHAQTDTYRGKNIGSSDPLS